MRPGLEVDAGHVLGTMGHSAGGYMIPKDRSSEFFGFFSISEKFGAILGPAVFEMASRTTGSSRSAILSVVVFFIVGAVVLFFVKVQEGQEAAAT